MVEQARGPLQLGKMPALCTAARNPSPHWHPGLIDALCVTQTCRSLWWFGLVWPSSTKLQNSMQRRVKMIITFYDDIYNHILHISDNKGNCSASIISKAGSLPFMCCNSRAFLYHYILALKVRTVVCWAGELKCGVRRRIRRICWPRSLRQQPHSQIGDIGKWFSNVSGKMRK